MSISIRNPHSILAALKSRPKDVTRISPAYSDAGEAWEAVVGLAQELKIPLEKGEKVGKHRPVKSDEVGRVGSGQAWIQEKKPCEIEELFNDVEPNERGLWIALDQVQDPQNLGAIFRLAGFFGVRGILLTQDRSAPLTSVVYDVSCGGVETVPFALAGNLQRAIEKAKEAGVWVVGTSEHAEKSMTDLSGDRPWLLVLGNEEKGLRRLTIELCDEMCTIPAASPDGVTSLNVGTAAAVLVHHFTRSN